MTIKRLLIACAAVLLFGGLQSASAAELRKFSIGYLEITDDIRYEEKRAYARIRIKPHDRPYPGAELAVRKSRVLGRAMKMKFEMNRAEAENAAGLVAEIDRMKAETGTRFFLVDADADVLNSVAKATADKDILLFNISEYSDDLRGPACQPHLMHAIPSYAMLTDTLAQFLIFKKWRNVMLLKGAEKEDIAFANAFLRSAKRFGVNLTKSQDFVLGNDPRQREQNNIALMTSDSDADVIFVSDVEGEFGRSVPYQTNRPTPVVGTEGLRAAGWHWAWERHGAPQLNQRFEKRAKRRMHGPDWAAWAAIRSLIESVIRTNSTEFKAVQSYLRSDQLNLDAYKGTPVSYRPWDNQLRQPVLLHTHNAITGRAPIRGFLHPTENLDTLGGDAGDKQCEFAATK